MVEDLVGRLSSQLAVPKRTTPRPLIKGLFGVPRTGIEPARLAAHAPETCASTSSATWAFFVLRCAKVTLFFESPTNLDKKYGACMRKSANCSYFLFWTVSLCFSRPVKPIQWRNVVAYLQKKRC